MKIKSLILLLLCALCWGPSYLFIKIAVIEIPPLTLVLLRISIAACILYAVCRFQGHRLLVWRHFWKHFLILGITLNALPFYLISSGELYISSSLAGVLNGLTLIFTAIFAHFFGTHEPLTKNKILGISLGLGGLAVIYLPLLFAEEIKGDIGALLLVSASLSYAAGTVYARIHLPKMPGIVVLTAQLFLATILLLPLSLLIDHPFSLPLPSYEAFMGVVALGVVATAIGFLLYYKNIQLAGATTASFATLIVPIFAMFLGAFFLHEKLTLSLYLGALLIILGAFTISKAQARST